MIEDCNKQQFQFSNLPAELAAILYARGIDTQEKAERFLYPKASDLSSPFILDGVADAVALIRKHISRQSQITIFGDYDCDGIGSAAILYLALKELGAEVSAFIPSRQEDGYGLSLNALNRVIERYSPQLIISVDCGISAPDEIRYAQEQGIDFLVTDHHEPQSVLPQCIIVNPKLQKGICEFCGAGVVFKIVEALKDREFALKFIDICAISTVADLVPLRDENRTIVRLGLDMMSSNRQRAGIKALLNAARVKLPYKKLTSYDIAYKIAPRLNASGRLSNAEKSFRLLVEEDTTLLALLAAELELENKNRQEICQRTIDEAVAMIKDYDLINNKVIVLAKDDWEGGVIGIAAAKLSQDYYRPTVLFAKRDGLLKGSCRSITGISIYDILSGCADTIVQYGGHSMAAGLSILPQMLDEFCTAVNAYTAQHYDDGLFFDDIRYDTEVDIKKINTQFARSLDCFEPYGNENPMPIFMYKAQSVPFKRIGGYNHIKYIANRECELVAFNAYNRLDMLVSDMSKRLYFTVESEIYNNTEKAKCYLKKSILDDISPKENAMLLDYLHTLLPQNANKGQIKSKCAPSPLYGHLVVTYCKRVFDRLCDIYPAYKRAYHYLDTINPYNTIILSPRSTLNYNNYCVVDILDKLYDEVAAASQEAQDCSNGFIISEQLPDINCIREIYIYLLTAQKGQKYLGQEDLYKRFIAKDYARSRFCFDISCLVLQEMGLLCLQDDSIIVRNHKVDMAKSSILKAIGTICRHS